MPSAAVKTLSANSSVFGGVFNCSLRPSERWPLRFLLLDNDALNAPEGLLVSDPIKVAVLGFWHVHAAEYAARAQQHPDTELVAAWDDDAARGRAGADAVGASFVADLDDLLDRDDIDAVTVTTATTAHHALMLRVAQAGKHIFTEKLLAPTVAEAEEIIAAADQAGIALVVSLPRLYHGYTRAIADQARRGAARQPDLQPDPAVA